MFSVQAVSTQRTVCCVFAGVRIARFFEFSVFHRNKSSIFISFAIWILSPIMKIHTQLPLTPIQPKVIWESTGFDLDSWFRKFERESQSRWAENVIVGRSMGQFRFFFQINEWDPVSGAKCPQGWKVYPVVAKRSSESSYFLLTLWLWLLALGSRLVCTQGVISFGMLSDVSRVFFCLQMTRFKDSAHFFPFLLVYELSDFVIFIVFQK